MNRESDAMAVNLSMKVRTPDHIQSSYTTRPLISRTRASPPTSIAKQFNHFCQNSLFAAIVKKGAKKVNTCFLIVLSKCLGYPGIFFGTLVFFFPGFQGVNKLFNLHMFA